MAWTGALGTGRSPVVEINHPRSMADPLVVFVKDSILHDLGAILGESP